MDGQDLKGSSSVLVNDQGEGVQVHAGHGIQNKGMQDITHKIVQAMAVAVDTAPVNNMYRSKDVLADGHTSALSPISCGGEARFSAIALLAAAALVAFLGFASFRI